MNQLLKIILSLSLSGGLLIAILLLCRPFVKDRLSKRWQYYIWLIVIVRLLLPFAPEKNLMGMVFQHLDNAVMQTDTSPQPEQELPALPETGFSHPYNVSQQAGSGEGKQLTPENGTASGIFETVKENTAVICLLVWLIVAACLLIRKVTVYQSFVKYIKAGRIEISDMQLWERVGKRMEQTGIKGAVGLYTNSLISSPLLIGFFRPCIMLPTTQLSESDFENTILHELMHYKRRDMFYKWLVQVAICFHWYNPFVYFMGREVNRACELSCDEAVIKSLDAGGRRAYGDTLLNAMGTGGNYKDSLACVTLNESTELLKERLDSIMRYQKKSKFIVSITLSDRTTIMVSFDESCRKNLQDKKMLSDLKKLVEKLKKEHSNSTPSLVRPLVVSIEYVGNSQPVELAKEYYTKNKLTRFSAIFSELDTEIQKEYCKKMIKDGKLAFLSSTAEHMEPDMLAFCLEQTYQKGELALFSSIVPYITDDMRQTWIARTSKDNKITYLSVLKEEEDDFPFGNY